MRIGAPSCNCQSAFLASCIQCEKVRIKELGHVYLDDYRLRHKSIVFAEYAVGNVIRHVGALMAVDVTEQTVTAYQNDAAERRRRSENDQRGSRFPPPIAG